MRGFFLSILLSFSTITFAAVDRVEIRDHEDVLTVLTDTLEEVANGRLIKPVSPTYSEALGLMGYKVRSITIDCGYQQDGKQASIFIIYGLEGPSEGRYKAQFFLGNRTILPSKVLSKYCNW